MLWSKTRLDAHLRDMVCFFNFQFYFFCVLFSASQKSCTAALSTNVRICIRLPVYACNVRMHARTHAPRTHARAHARTCAYIHIIELCGYTRARYRLWGQRSKSDNASSKSVCAATRCVSLYVSLCALHVHWIYMKMCVCVCVCVCVLNLHACAHKSKALGLSGETHR